MDKYLDFCKKNVWKEKMDISKNYHVPDSDDIEKKINKNIDVSIVSPTQAAVEQAKSEVKEMMDINRGKRRKVYQIGGKDRCKSKSRTSSVKKINKKDGHKKSWKEKKFERKQFKKEKKIKKIIIIQYRSISI